MTRPRSKRMKPRDPMLWQVRGSIQATFGPMERILRDLEAGTMTIRDGQVAVYLYGPSLTPYPMVDGVRGVVDVFQSHAVRHNRPIDTSPLDQLISHFDQLDLPSLDLIRRCRACLVELRRHAARMRLSDAQSLIVGTQIQAEVQQLQEVKHAA